MKRNVSMFLTILFTSFYAQSAERIYSGGFYHVDSQGKSAVCFVIMPPKKEIIQTPLYIFSKAAFSLPKALEYCTQKSLPLIIAIPDVFQNVHTISDDAFWQEGARVSLAWASAYARFKKLGTLDVRILKLSNEVLLDQHTLLLNIEAILHKNVHYDVNISPEFNIEQRIFGDQELSDAKATVVPQISEIDFATVDTTPVFQIPNNLAEPLQGQKRFLVTGAAGFLGSHLCRALLSLGHQVIALDNLACCTLDNIKDMKNNVHFTFHQTDVTHPFSIDGTIDSIIHMASIPSPAFYYELPVETLKTGLDGTRNCLDLACRKKAQFFFASTSEVYGDPDINPQPETYCGNVSPIGKRSQYDMSKRGAETLIKLYTDLYRFDARIARIFNTYGPGMQLNDGRVITNFINAILTGTPMTLYGNGNQTRSFAYVSDTIDGLLKIIHTDHITHDTPLTERIFNIGNPDEFTIAELALAVNQLAAQNNLPTVSIVEIEQFDSTDPKKRRPDLTRSHTMLNYVPHIELIKGLEETLHYFKKKM